MKYETADPVTVSLEDLKSGSIPPTTLLSAFGPSSLGILLVRNLPPTFPTLRTNLLTYSSLLASLPPSILSTLEVPSAKYLIGWSCGKETLANGRYDTLKGSYYINCAWYKDESLDGAEGEGYEDFPEYTAGNFWPGEGVLPGFEKSVKELCGLIIDTAVLVARACDRYAGENIEDYVPGYLEHVVKTSSSTKARLLHYFPPPPERGDGKDEEEEDLDSWCGTHIDHGCLTGLTSAMFVDEVAHPPSSITSSLANGNFNPLPELPTSPDPAAGLYIKNRLGNIVKVAIPRDCLAFQTGEALEVITKGKFKAVPHFVRGARRELGGGVARNTLAVFTQPNLFEMVGEGKDFAGFAREIVERNH